MEKLLKNVQKEIEQISEQGISSGNLDALSKLIDIEKDIYEVKEKEKEEREGEQSMIYGNYYGARGRDGRYMDGYNPIRDRYDERYGRREYYRGPEHDNRIYQHLDRMMEGADEYQYGRSRYMDGGTQERMNEGLEKLMYATCVFIESMMDFAETPEEKEIIRRHIHKIKNM